RQGDRPRVPPRDRGGVIPRASGDDDDDVLRLLGNPQGPSTVPLLDTATAPHAQDVGVALADLLEWDAGVLEQGLTHASLVEALPRRNRGMLGAEYEERFLAHEHVVGAGDGDGPRDRLEHLVGGLALVDDVGRRRTAESRDGARLCREAPVDVKWRPGAVRLVLGEAAGVLGRVAERRLVGLLRHATADRRHDQPNRTADRRVGPEAGTEQVPPRI